MATIESIPPRLHIRATDYYHAHKLAIKKILGRAILPTQEEIVDKAISVDIAKRASLYFPGIYFLVNRDKLVYIGRSVDVFARVEDHFYCTSHFAFDRFHYIKSPFRNHTLNFLEGFFIDFYSPPQNKAFPMIKATDMVHHL